MWCISTHCVPCCIQEACNSQASPLSADAVSSSLLYSVMLIPLRTTQQAAVSPASEHRGAENWSKPIEKTLLRIQKLNTETEIPGLTQKLQSRSNKELEHLCPVLQSWKSFFSCYLDHCFAPHVFTNRISRHSRSHFFLTLKCLVSNSNTTSGKQNVICNQWLDLVNSFEPCLKFQLKFILTSGLLQSTAFQKCCIHSIYRNLIHKTKGNDYEIQVQHTIQWIWEKLFANIYQLTSHFES